MSFFLIRADDFIVNEVDKNGKVLQLTDESKPEIISQQQNAKQNCDRKIHHQNLKIDVAKLNDSIEQYIKANFKSEPPIVNINELNKDERREIHQYIRENFIDLESKTEIVDDKKFLKIFSISDQAKKRKNWPNKMGNHVHFVLCKKNMDTTAAVNELCRRLRSAVKTFAFAGNKDKRGITTQMMSAYQTQPLEIWKAAQDFNEYNKHGHYFSINVGHFQLQKNPLRLGDHSGNKFEIILRNVRPIFSDSTIDGKIETNIMESLKTVENTGFINYFGMQRFGQRYDSHKLGIYILQKNFKKLVEEILVEKTNPSSKELVFNEAIRIWRETGNASDAYKKMNFKYSIEGSLLRALSKVQPNDYNRALLMGLPRNSRLLYLHAFQSYIWNQVASYRFRTYGQKVVIGDLVISSCNNSTNNEIKNNNSNGKIKFNIPDEQILLVTKENIHSFTIFDIVLPIIGTLSKLPQNDTRAYIEEIFNSEGVTLEQFSSLGKEWCFNGSYRKLFVRPTQLTWQLLEYFKDNEPIRGDNSKPIEDNETSAFNNEQLSVKKKIALKIDVILPTSSYATVFLREVTKVSSISLKNSLENDENVDH